MIFDYTVDIYQGVVLSYYRVQSWMCFRTSIGRPPARVSHAKTVHWTVIAPILRFAMLRISRSAERDLGRRPKTLQP